jgi:hypothetical protein
VNNSLEWKWSYSRYYHGIYLEELRRTIKRIRISGPWLRFEPVTYESGKKENIY